MRKFMFAALAGVFMLSSGFEKSSDTLENEDIADCQCRCTSYSWVRFGNTFVLVPGVSYTNGSQACESLGGGVINDYDKTDCRDGGGMLNARRVEDLQAAEQGTGC